VAEKKLVGLEAMTLTLRLPEDGDDDGKSVAAIISKKLEGIENLPVIPREVEDVLSISSSERHRWLKDGRLPSAGTRTVKLRGRARKITFHVFDPRHIEDVLDRDMPTVWREEDPLVTAENRRRAAGKAAVTRAAGRASKGNGTIGGAANTPSDLTGWEEFELDGLLR
jgi:hypothetical protein